MRGEPLNVGLIGVGRWGRNIARTIREEVPEMRLARAATSNPEARARVGDDCTLHEAWPDLLGQDDLDAVLLAVPARLHREIGAAVIASGRPLFMEKPMCLSVADAVALRDLGRDAGAIVHVDHVDLHNPAIHEIEARAATLGAVQEIDGAIGSFYDRRPDITPLWEYSPHFLAVAVSLMGQMPETVAARNLPRETEPKDDPSKEIVEVTLGFSGGREARLRVGNGMALKTRAMTVRFADAGFRYDDRSDPRLWLLPNGVGDSRPVEIDRTLPLTLAIRAFGAAVRRGVPDTAGLEMGLRVVGILEAATRAQASGETVVLSRVMA